MHREHPSIAAGHDDSAAAAGFSRIVVAYDGSDRAEDALALALRLREPRAGALTLGCVRVSRVPWRFGEQGAPPTAVADATETMLAEARHPVPRGIPVRVREMFSTSAARGLTELAEAERADLVIVGSSTHALPGRVSTERTAGRLLHGAPCAVAVPPADARDVGPFRHIGVAFDGSPESHAGARDRLRAGGARRRGRHDRPRPPRRRHARADRARRRARSPAPAHRGPARPGGARAGGAARRQSAHAAAPRRTPMT